MLLNFGERGGDQRLKKNIFSRLFEKIFKKSFNNALTERQKGANLPAEKRQERALITPEQRRLQALEKKNNPKYNKQYEPYYDEVEAHDEEIKNPRYAKISNRYKYLKFAALALFIIYCVSMYSVFSEEITIENFRYMLRSVDFEGSASSGKESDIIYVASESNKFLKYRNYLALVNSDKLTVYDTSGGVAISREHGYLTPTACAGEKYLLLYDSMGNGYSIYTYFAKEHEEKLEYPISHAAVSDSGIYALASKSRDYSGAIYIYNGSFKLMNKIMKNKNVSAMALSSSGDELLLCTSQVDAYGRVQSEITLLPTSTDQNRLQFTLENTSVYSCAYLKDGAFVLMCADGMRFYDSEGGLSNAVLYSGFDAELFRVCDDTVLLCTKSESDRSESALTLYDSRGRKIFTTDIKSSQRDIACFDDGIYVLYGDDLIKYDLQGNTSLHKIKRARRALCLAFNENGLYVCTEGAAYIPKFDK